MKYLVTILFIFLFSESFSQSIVNRAGAANTVSDSRLQAKYNLFIPRYDDTTAANVQRGIDSCGAIIYTYDVNVFWMRSCSTSKHWEQIGGSVINIFNNSITNVSFISQVDSSITIQICTGAGACDTLTFVTNITNTIFSSATIINDSTIQFCGIDTVASIVSCDTVSIPSQNIYVFQQGVSQVGPGIVEFGSDTSLPLSLLVEDKSLIGTAGDVIVTFHPNGLISLPTYDSSKTGQLINRVLGVDALGNVIVGGIPTADSCGVFGGGVVTWDSLLTFDISPATYALCCDNILRTTSFDTVMLSEPDTGYLRYDAVIVGVNGVEVVQGEQSTDPEQPQLDSCQQLLTYILVIGPHDDTVVATQNICQNVIFDENNFSTGEYSVTTPGALTIDTANTVSVAHLTKSLNVGNFTNNQSFKFTSPVTVDLSSTTALKFYISLKAVLAGNVRITFDWMNGNTSVSNSVQLGGAGTQFGFDGTTLGYQVVTISMGAWTFTSKSITTLRVRFTGAGSGFYMDWVQLQGCSISTPPTPTVSFASGNLSPLFTTTITNPTTNITQTFTQSVAPAYSVFGNPTGSIAIRQDYTINLSTPQTTGLLNVERIAPCGEGYFIATIDGVQTCVPNPTTEVNQVIVMPPLFVDTTDNELYDTLTLRYNNWLSMNVVDSSLQFGSRYPDSSLLDFDTYAGLNGHFLLFQHNGFDWLFLNSNVGDEQSDIQAIDSVGNSHLTLNSHTGVYSAELSVTDGSNIVSLTEDAITNKTTLTSDSILLNSTLSGASSGYVWTLKDPTTGSGYWGVSSTPMVGRNGITDSVDRYILGGTLYKSTSVAADANQMTWTFNNISTNGFNVTSTSTSASSNNQHLINVDLSGANTNSSQTTYGIYSSNTHTGSGVPTNIGVLGTASGASFNYGVMGDGTQAGVYGFTSGTFGVGVFASASGSNGFAGQYNATSTAVGLEVSSVSGLPIHAKGTPSSTNSVFTMINISRLTSGTAANGEGGSIDFNLQADDNNERFSNSIISKWTVAANATRTSQLLITGVNTAVTNTLITVEGDGATTITGNGAGNVTALTANAANSGTGVVGNGGFVGVLGVSSQSSALKGTATSTAIGVLATAVDGYASSYAVNPSSTNTVVGISQYSRTTSGTAADGIGGSLDFTVEASTGTAQISNQIISSWTTANNATRVSQFMITGVDNAVTGNIISFEGNKRTKLYGRLEVQQGADVASVAGAIAVGLDGNVFELTGTNAVTLISNLNWVNGSMITFVFTSTATLTDGTANSGTDIGMELAGNANFVGSADDVITLVLSEIGGTQRWREVSRSVN